jgi:hypothetical protein
MNTYEDDEFERIEMEQRIRAKQKEMFGIPFVTQDELQELLKDEDEVQTPRDT